MHPARSIILFTTLSGLGFGLLVWLGIDAQAPTGWVGFIFFVIAYALAGGGLMASTFHLGHPERAIKAFSQWRSSWLSREGIAAVATLIVMGIYGFFLVVFGLQISLLGWIGAALALVTVYTTSMIYAQLKTVPRWNTPLTSALFICFALAGGALLSGRVLFSVNLLVIAAIIQVIWWQQGDNRFSEAGSTLASATGLGQIGQVRAFEAPHTGTNYLMDEFMHVVGRKHALKLRGIALILMVGVPILCLLLPFNHLFALLAVVSHLIGVYVSRWLFFAEAEHVVGLYYGKR